MVVIGCANLHKAVSLTKLKPELVSIMQLPSIVQVNQSKARRLDDNLPTIKVRKKDTVRANLFDPKRINSALDKIDRIGDMQDLLIRTQQGYFRVADSARNRASRIKERDSTIKMLLSIRDSMNARDSRQSAVNKQTLSYLTDSKQAKAYSSMFEKVMTASAIFVALVVALHFAIYLYNLSRNGKYQ